ncbi:hypothetical protein MHY87_05070 [Microvirga sp. ACRRW]|uniref:hypothetical protein n=1 Tax=Microvirga sp. ACRRW TaxID=2918205 RepID=UPI001EF6CD07|nr:hypothetical protein [Microvirga sp. ACRRW]MCG7392271.1 hypothetical protein [Microvirga sp. ACRRW]
MTAGTIGGLTQNIIRVPDQDVAIAPGATIPDGDRSFKRLIVSLDTGRANEMLTIKTDTGEVQVASDGSVIIRDATGDTNIGSITYRDFGYIEFEFNTLAKASHIQTLLRALMYNDAFGEDGFTLGSAIAILLEDEDTLFNGYLWVSDQVTGTDAADAFETDERRLSADDVIDGGDGDDTLQLVGGGDFYINEMVRFVSVETIQGTAANDRIYIDGSQLAGVRKIAGGGGTNDRLFLSGAGIDLTNVDISGFKEIQIQDARGSVLKVDDVDTAMLVTSYYSDSDTIELTSGTLTDAQRLQLHRQGFETVIAKDATGDTITTIHDAPEIAAFGEAKVTTVVGVATFLDVGRDSVLTVDSGLLRHMSVRAGGGSTLSADDKINIDLASGISLAAGTEYPDQRFVLVDGIKIGEVYGLGSPLASFEFNGDATTARVQKLIRALTYTNGSAHGGGDPRKVSITLTDVAHREVEFSANVEVLPNDAPTNPALAGMSVLENAATGTKIGDLSATDAALDTLTYEIQRSDGTWGTTDGRFVIEGTQLKVANGLLLDHEQAKTHAVTIRVTDQAGLSSQKTFTVAVDDVNPENVTGSAGNDVIYGGAGNDTLDGGSGNDELNGGKGRDRMIGGAGNDIYHVDTKGDVIVEAKNGGTDLVYSAISYTLGATLEHLVGTGKGALSLTGNSLANGILGNNAKNTIKGGAGNDTVNGGGGNDVLYGGSGKDVFAFNTKPNARTNKDVIKDWNPKDDVIHLENQVFTALKAGKLAKGSFVLGAKAKDKTDFVGYNKTTGDLWYDANGSGKGGQVVFANIGRNKKIAHDDFFAI